MRGLLIALLLVGCSSPPRLNFEERRQFDLSVSTFDTFWNCTDDKSAPFIKLQRDILRYTVSIRARLDAKEITLQEAHFYFCSIMEGALDEYESKAKTFSDRYNVKLMRMVLEDMRNATETY